MGQICVTSFINAPNYYLQSIKLVLTSPVHTEVNPAYKIGFCQAKMLGLDVLLHAVRKIE